MDTKRCTLCKKDLLATEEYFYPQQGGRFGLHSICRICRKESYNPEDRKKYYERIRDRASEYSKAYYVKKKQKAAIRKAILGLHPGKKYTINDIFTHLQALEIIKTSEEALMRDVGKKLQAEGLIVFVEGKYRIVTGNNNE